MIYELFVEFVGNSDPDFETLLANSEYLQSCLAAAALFLACFALVMFCYMILVLFRGWK